MTVSTEVDHNDYVGNGVTTQFPYTFRVFKKSDLVVTVLDLSQNMTTLILDTDYTVSGAGGYTGGNVTLSTPLTSGWQISIARVLPITQETDLRNQGKFFAEVHEDAFDRLTMLLQQAFSSFRLSLRKPSSIANWYDALNNYIRNLRDPSQPQDAATKNYVDNLSSANLNKTLRVPEGYIPELPSVELRKNKIVGMDSVGNPIMLLPQSGSASDVLLQLASTEAGRGDALITVVSPLAGAVARSQHDKNTDFRTMEDFGAIGDGTNHPLSERFSTLTAAQMVYSFVTSLTQSIDWAAAMAAGASGGFSMLSKTYSLSHTLAISGAISINGNGDGFSKFLFTGVGDGIVITLPNSKDGKFWLRDFGIYRTGTPSSTTKETALKIDGRAQILVPGSSSALAQLGYRTEFRGAIENIRIAGNDVLTGGWFRGIHMISVMNFRIEGFGYCGYVQSSGVLLGEAITIAGDGYVVDFSISRFWIFYCNIALNLPDYVEGAHIHDFELVNVNIGMLGGVVQAETVVPSLTGQVASPGVLSPWVYGGHMNCLKEAILMAANCNLAKLHNLHLFCNPTATDTQGRAAISLSYGSGAQINDIYVLQDRAANTAYLDSNSAVFLGAMTGCQIGNIIHGAIANRGSAIIITDGTNDNKFWPIKTNAKYGVSGVGTTQRNSFGPVAPGFGTARFNIASRDLNSFNYDVVSRTDTITLTGSGVVENYYDITPISTLSEVPAEVYVGMGYSSNTTAMAYYAFDESAVNRIRIRVRASVSGSQVFRVHVQYPLT